MSGLASRFAASFPSRVFLCVVAVAVVLWLVLDRAWVSDDALITLRYVQNTLEGLGPVYNVGERVQGYTHPLWFGLLVLGTWLYSDPYMVAVALGLLLTAATLGVLVREIVRLGPRSWLGLVTALAVPMLILGSSRSWVAFQTGGLENALTHLLVALWVVELLRQNSNRPTYVVELAALICLSRPDQLFLVAPSVAVAAWRGRALRPWKWLRPGTALVLAWIVFATLYYGTPVPNTAVAKLGTYAHRTDAIRQGLLYLVDWALFEPVAFLALVIGTLAIWKARTSVVARSVAVGIVLQAIWVVWIGGDFMRGRFWLSVFTASVAGLTMVLAQQLDRRSATRVLVLLGFVLIGQTTFAPDTSTGWNRAGISDERLFYPGYHLRSVVQRGRLVPRDLADLTDDLSAYVETCGPTTLHLPAPAYYAFSIGADLIVIDALGLTDAYIARLPADHLVESQPRPGHPFKRIPLEYLSRRGDIALIDDWQTSVRQGDCSLRAKALAVERSGYWIPDPPKPFEAERRP